MSSLSRAFLVTPKLCMAPGNIAAFLIGFDFYFFDFLPYHLPFPAVQELNASTGLATV